MAESLDIDTDATTATLTTRIFWHDPCAIVLWQKTRTEARLDARHGVYMIDSRTSPPKAFRISGTHQTVACEPGVPAGR